MRLLILSLTVICLLGLTGCDVADQYKDRFATLKTGDTREHVLEVMGPVTPGLSAPAGQANATPDEAETLVWKSVIGNGVYTVKLEKGLVAELKNR